MSDGKPVRTYFLGSGKLGIAVVDALLQDARVSLLGIGSQCDKPFGRRKIITPTQLCQHALTRGLDVDRVPSVNSEDFLSKMRSLELDLLVVLLVNIFSIMEKLIGFKLVLMDYLLPGQRFLLIQVLI